MTSSYWKSFFSWPLVYELGKNSYLVTLSPSSDNKNYSYHMNYTDLSTLQYLAANQAFLAYTKAQQQIGQDIKLQSYEPTMQERNGFKKPTYVLIKTQNGWSLFYYEPTKERKNIGIDMISGLEIALRKLPKKTPEQLTVLEIKPIETKITAYHLGIGGFLGTGNGWEIANSINTYLLHFFNAFLKDHQDVALSKCASLTKNTFISCGSDVFSNT